MSTADVSWPAYSRRLVIFAIAFYERLGFKHVGQREFDGDSCLVMRLARTPDT